MNRLYKLALLAAAVSMTGIPSTSIAEQPQVDSAGTSVEVTGRGTNRVSNNISSGGVNGSNIVIIPPALRKTVTDLTAAAGEGDYWTASCVMPQQTAVSYLGSQKTFVGFSEGTGDNDLGDAEYVKNHSSYLQFRGKQVQRQARLFKSLPAEQVPVSRALKSYQNSFVIKFDKSTGYSVTYNAGFRSGSLFAGSSTTSDSLSNFGGFSYNGPYASSSSILNHPIVGAGLVYVEQPEIRSFQYIGTDPSYGDTETNLHFSGGLIGYYTPYSSRPRHGIKIHGISHAKSGANYTKTVYIDVEMMGVGDITKPFYAGYTVYGQKVMDLEKMAPSQYFDVRGYAYKDMTLYNYYLNRSAITNPNASKPFRKTINCNFVAKKN